MSTIYSNYDALALSAGTYETGVLGNGISAETVHRIHCLTAGSIDISPIRGDTFTWVATTNQFIDVVVRKLIVNSGTHVAFRAKHNQVQFFGN